MADDVCLQVKETVKSISKSLQCPICLEYLDHPCRMPCFHEFCKKCIETVLLSKSPKCPLCKEKISKRGISESKKLAEIIEAVKELEGAVTIDTGLTDSPLPTLPSHSKEATGTPGIKLHSIMFPSPVKNNAKRKRT